MTLVVLGLRDPSLGSASLLRGLPGFKICDCPTTSSSVLGRIRAASGAKPSKMLLVISSGYKQRDPPTA